MLLHSRADLCPKFSIDDIKLVSGPIEGVCIDGTIVQISEGLCEDSARHESETILITYSVAGPFGVKLPRMAIFNLSSTKDGPVISSSLEQEPFVKDGVVCFDLSPDLNPQQGRLF